MKIKLETGKFYPCYPVYVFSYYAENGKELITTMSSSFTLGNLLVLGVGKSSKFATILQRNPDFCINFLSRTYLRQIELAGTILNRNYSDKTELVGFHFDKSKASNAPYIKEASLIWECRMKNCDQNGDVGFLTVTAEILGRLCDSNLFKNNEFQYNQLDIPLFEADSRQKVYRFMTDEARPAGLYYKDFIARKKSM
ncbi:flavin reductase [Bacteroides neonati]|uniref:flavin reductase n=1 Tax=Bacteroides neonati TaxID=1347393 RepID=UPI00165217A5|nr:flavin reductase [Bacteroides neonati]